MEKNYKLLKKQAKNLRLTERKSNKEITKILDVSQATISLWLRDVPLTDEEKKLKMSNRSTNINSKKLREPKSKWFDVVDNKKYSPTELGNICEVGVWYRLIIHQFIVYKSLIEGATVDFIIARRDNPNKLIKIQVKKCTKASKNVGLPNIRVTKADGRHGMKTYNNSELDFLIGYDIYTDCAYIFSYEEMKNHKRYISIKPENKERWDLVK